MRYVIAVSLAAHVIVHAMKGTFSEYEQQIKANREYYEQAEADQIQRQEPSSSLTFL